MPGQRILVVEDNPANAALVSYLLERRGYDVQVATDASEAVARIDAFQPQLILMDIQLPGMDGLQLARQIKADARTRHVRIVALTAYAMIGDEAKAIEAGCDAYMSKPIDTVGLPKLVARLLDPSTGEPQVS